MLAVVVPQRVCTGNFVLATVDRAIAKCRGCAMHARVRLLHARTADSDVLGPHVAREHVAPEAREHHQGIEDDGIQGGIIMDGRGHGGRGMVLSHDAAIRLRSFAVEGLRRLH